MMFSKLHFWKQIFTIFTCLVFNLSCFQLPAIAQLAPTDLSLAATQVTPYEGVNPSAFIFEKTSIFAFRFPFFRRRGRRRGGAPTGRSSAAKRGQCNDLNQSFVALAPRSGLISEDLSLVDVGLTTQAQPTAFVYLPDLLKSPALNASDTLDPKSVKAQFMIQHIKDESLEDLIPNPIDLDIPDDGGLAQINFETLGITLIPQQTYHWYLSIVCDSERPSRNPSVDAWIEVVDPDTKKNIEDGIVNITDDYEKIQFYIDRQIWHETVTSLIDLRCQEPDNVQHQQELKELLTSILYDAESTNELENQLSIEITEAIDTLQCPVKQLSIS